MAYDHYLIAFSSVLGTNILALLDGNTPQLLGIIQGKTGNKLKNKLHLFSTKLGKYTLCIETSTEKSHKMGLFVEIRSWAPKRGKNV